MVRTFANYLFSRAKTYWYAWAVAKLLTFIIASYVTLVTRTHWSLPWIAVALSAVGDGLLLASDRVRSDAESLLRKLDLQDSLGWQIDRRDVADLEARYPVRPADARANDSYFASKSVGVERGYENLRESAWWSKHLSERMFAYNVIALGGSLTVTLIALVAAVRLAAAPNGQEVALSVAKTAITFLMLAFSLGILKLALGYHSFRVKSEAAEDRANTALAPSAVNPDVLPANRAWAEYQLARAGAPMIPTFVWRWHQERLNRAWTRQYGSRNEADEHEPGASCRVFRRRSTPTRTLGTRPPKSHPRR